MEAISLPKKMEEVFKMTYYVSEVANLHSFAKAEKISAASLVSAKRLASRYQMFLDTVLYLGRAVNDNSFIVEPIAVKKGNKWTNLCV